MKICFITGQRRTTRCGITDYTELLARELKNLGHQVSILSLSQNSSQLLSALNNCDTCSIQYAPYAFSETGFIETSTFKFLQGLSGINIHINFHEIWIGAYPSASWKEKLIGWRQKKDLLRISKLAQPNLTNCSNPAVLERLSKVGINANYLYLFGNIPFAPLHYKKPSDNLKVVIFGTLYEKFPFTILIETLMTISHSMQKSIQIRIVGKQRESNGLNNLKRLSAKYSFLIQEVGELASNLISQELQICDLGICTTPFDILGKSGATAAMLEHRLPVLAYDDGDTPQECLFIPDPFKEQIFMINDDSSVEKLLQYIEKPRKSFFDGVAHTANKMLDLIS